jgi:hypothetical protein
MVIRVWIKTEPMKQWDVSREYRRRFKQALQNSDTAIPFPQRDVWLHPSDEFRLNLQGSLDGVDQDNPNPWSEQHITPTQCTASWASIGWVKRQRNPALFNVSTEFVSPCSNAEHQGGF